MLCELVELYRRGARRPREETQACARLIGRLSLQMRPNGTPVLVIMAPTGYSNSYADLVMPLLNPTLSKFNDKGFAFRGTQRETVAGTMREFVQVWALRPAAPDAKPSDYCYHPECARQIGDDKPLAAATPCQAQRNSSA